MNDRTSKQRLLALVADLDQATNRMIVGTWSVQGVANTLRYIANGLPDETTTHQLSATDRLHNICDGLSEQADESPFTREEWEAVDKQTARLNTALRNLIDAVRNVEIEKRPWDLFMALPLQNAYQALKHEDPLNAVEPGAPQMWYCPNCKSGNRVDFHHTSCPACGKLRPAEKASEPPMAMLPNVHHPGQGCSCRECLRRWPDKASAPHDKDCTCGLCVHAHNI